MKSQCIVNFAVTGFVNSNSWRRLTARFADVWSNVGIDLVDGTGIVRAVKLRGMTTAGSAQFEAEEVSLNMLTMLTVRCYSDYGG